MSKPFTALELEAYLDEALPVERMAEVEHALRNDKLLARRVSGINARRDAGVHSLGEIWRRERRSCPSREALGSFLLGALDDDERDYIAFHLEVIQCRVCLANHDDLEAQSTQSVREVEVRRRKYFQSSAGMLRKK